MLFPLQFGSATKMAETHLSKTSKSAQKRSERCARRVPSASSRPRTKKWSWIFTVCAVVTSVFAGFAAATGPTSSGHVKVRFLGFVNDVTSDDGAVSRVWLQVEGRFDPHLTQWKVTGDPGECTAQMKALDLPADGRRHVAVTTVPVVSSQPADQLAGREVYLCSKLAGAGPQVWSLSRFKVSCQLL